MVDLENSEEPMPIVTPTSAVSTTIYNSCLAEDFGRSWHGIHIMQVNFMAFMVFVAWHSVFEVILWPFPCRHSMLLDAVLAPWK